jgi:hypothetical protein
MVITHSFKSPYAPHRISTGDEVLFLTDVQYFYSAMTYSDQEQVWYVAGGLDLKTGQTGFFKFSSDDVSAMLREGLPAAPWPKPISYGLRFRRYKPQGNHRLGRFKTEVEVLQVDEATVASALAAKPALAKSMSLTSNFGSYSGMWDKQLLRATALRALEAACLIIMQGQEWFAAKDLKAACPSFKGNLSRIFKDLMHRGLLRHNGQSKRGSKYSFGNLWAGKVPWLRTVP